ncbi:MAG: MFS transporter [Pirellulaceae bacterium]|nr:MFS transporter [Pirellulaceae bacterium]
MTNSTRRNPYQSEPTTIVNGGSTSAPTNIRWHIFALACGASFLLYLHRYSWNVVGPKLQEQFAFSHTQVALLFSLFYYTYASGQIPSGVIIDRFGPHRFLSLMILAWSAAMTAIAHTQNMLLLGICRLTFGAAQAGCYPALAQVTRRWFPANRRTLLQGWIATTFGRSGGAMSPIIIGSLLMGWCGLNWQTAISVLGGLGAIYALVFWKLFRNSPAEHCGVNRSECALISEGAPTDENSASPGPTVLPLKVAARNVSLRFFVVQQFLDAGSDVAFVSLIGAYFLQARGMDIATTGWLASLPLWGGALGGIVGGWLNDRLIHATGSRRWSRSGVGCIGKILGCLMLLLVSAQTTSQAAALCLLAAKFFSDWSQPTTWGACTDMGGRFSATLFSIINTAGTSGGITMPIVFGGLLDWFTTSTEVHQVIVSTTNWQPLFYLLSAMYLASGLCWLMVDCTRRIEAAD